MYKKIFILFFTIAYVGSSRATQVSHQTNLSPTHEHIQKRLNHLTIDAPFWTAPTKGLAYALIGAAVVISSTMLNETATKIITGLTGSVIVAAGFAFSFFSAMDNDHQRARYERELMNLFKKQSASA